MRALLPDTWHFHRRNFASLFDAMRRLNMPWYVDRSGRRLWKAHGNYRPHSGLLRTHLAALEGLTPEALRQATHRDIPLWEVARSELLCLLLARPHWYAGAGPNTPDAVFDRAVGHGDDRRDLLLCMAAARHWIDHWHAVIAARGPFTHALCFSGSYIYTRALHLVAGDLGLRTFGLETAFTGHEWYLEERASPLSNQSQLSTPDRRRALALPDDPTARDRFRAAAHGRLRGMRNKNVKSRTDVLEPPPFPNRGAGTVFIVGQVLNDFSLIETPLPEMSSLAIYRRLIGRLLEETEHTVLFKGHPWERRRPNLSGPVTLDALRAFVADLPDVQRARVRLVEHEPIGALFAHADHVIGICSQGLLEACQAGFRPIQIGQAFYGGAGFTHDLPDVGAAVEGLVAGRLAGRLMLDEYRAFEDFLAKALVLHLMTNSPAGTQKVAATLQDPSFVPEWQAELHALAVGGHRQRSLGEWLTILRHGPGLILRQARSRF